MKTAPRPFVEFATACMSPAYPLGTCAALRPAPARHLLRVGAVYFFYLHSNRPSRVGQVGRLTKLWGNALEFRTDAAPNHGIWLLNEIGYSLFEVSEA